MDAQKPQIGTGVYVWKDDKVLLGKRKSSYGLGAWCPPGGKLDLHERGVDAARRELREETSLEVGELKFIGYTDELEDPHFVTLHFSADWVSGKPELAEPDKFETWEWFDWKSLPQPLFRPVENLIKSGFNPK
jgi:8-oxo-dGTP diphosphatase